MDHFAHGARVSPLTPGVPPQRLARVIRLAARGAVGLAFIACRDGGPTTAPPLPPSGPTVSSVVVLPASVYLQAGQERRVSVEARDSAGLIVTAPSLTWRSDAPATATVDASGLIRAVAPGSARITVTAGTHSALVQVGVSAVCELRVRSSL